VTFDTTMPNGILISQDQSTLYVAKAVMRKALCASCALNPIREDGSLGTYITLFTWGEDARGVHRGIDGMCLDADGNIVATAGWEVSGTGPMIYVFSPAGRVLETHPVPAIRPTNCCFGGPDMTTLFRDHHARPLLQGCNSARGVGHVSVRLLLFAFDAGRARDLSPLRGLGAHQTRKIFRRALQRLAGKAGETCANGIRAQRVVHGGI
jgi:hypothetical protein